MTLRTCTVSCEDSEGHQHSLEVTAETLYEAVAQCLESKLVPLLQGPAYFPAPMAFH
jgi:hypothetical protein